MELSEFTRLEMLVNSKNMKKINDLNVIIFGIGGVGSFTAESLARSGVNNLTLVDFSEISLTNINRQIHSNTKNIGSLKTEVMKQRILDINPRCNVKLISKMITRQNVEDFFQSDYDYVVDAIDLLGAKLELIEYCYNKNINIISSMGFGNRMNPSLIKYSTLDKTNTCPLARSIRNHFKKKKIKMNKINVVFSEEIPLKPLDSIEIDSRKVIPGSNGFVPPVAGLFITSYIIRNIIKL